MSLIGTLSELKLADVLRVLAAGRKSGVLTAIAPGQEAVLRIQKGVIVQAAAARLQGDDAVLDLFGWTDGQLTFVPEERAVTANVTHGMDVLLLEGERLGPTLHRMNRYIPSDSITFQLAVPPEGAHCTIGDTEGKVLRFVDSVRDVREIVEATGLPRAQVAAALFQLGEAGFLEKIELHKRVRALGPRAFSSFSLLAPDGRTPETVELEEKLLEEWRKAPRFWREVARVEVRTLGYRKSALLTPVFRSGLGRDAHLPRPSFGELGVREGEDVLVRPVA